MKLNYQTLDIPNDPTPWIITNETDDKTWCVLWLQGWTSTIEGQFEGISRMARSSKVDFAMLNYAGHGTHPISLDQSTRKQHLDEVSFLYDELKRKGYKKIIVIGGSFGAYMAALLSQVRPLAAIILCAPANYPDNEFLIPTKDIDWSKVNDFRNNRDAIMDTDAIRAIKQFEKMVYILEHQDDEVIPKIIPQSYFNAAKQANYMVIPRTKHSPERMSDPHPHFEFIESAIVSILKLIQLETKIPKTTQPD